MISQRAVNLIVECEVTSRSQYEKKYQHPEWPGGMSGVTIGIGYDLGYSDVVKLHNDFDGLLPAQMISVMERCLGVRGQAAAELLSSVRNLISVPWDAACQVFLHNDIPQWVKRVCTAIPGAGKLSPDCLGALVSLAYNRGASFNTSGARYTEMRNIKAHILAGSLRAVADDFRAMKRLWPGANERGLPIRREAEAKIWELGLDKPADSAPLIALTAKEEPPTTLKRPIPEGAVSGAAAAGAVTTVTATQGVHWGWILLGVILTVAVFIAIREINAKPTVARQKDAP